MNGFNNSGVLVAAPVSSRALPPRVAVALALLGEFTGPFVFGVAVAATIGRDFLQSSAVDIDVLLAAAISVITWNGLTYLVGVPASSSHALVGGLSGASLLAAGLGVFKVPGLMRILGGLLFGPLVGLAAGYLLLKLILWVAQGATPRINNFFRNAQAVTTVILSMGHGTNDGQKTMGLITLGLVALGAQQNFFVPFWVVLAVASAMSLGIVSGGYRIVHTLGNRIYAVRPVHGFAAQIAGGAIVIGTAALGAPVATTHVIGTTIMGVGTAERARGVRWGVVGQILAAWLFTIPATALISALLYMLLRTMHL